MLFFQYPSKLPIELARLEMFTAICPNFNLYLDLFCENEINEFVEVVINAYKEKKCVFTVGGSFGICIKALSKFNSQK